MAIRRVDDGLVRHVVLLRPIHFLLRYDVLPFACAYLVLFAIYYSNIGSFLYPLTTIPVVLVVQLILFMLGQGSVHLYAKLGHVEVDNVSQCSEALVVCAKNNGKSRIVPISRVQETSDLSVCNSKFEFASECFKFQQLTYSFSKERNTFVRVGYPVEGNIKDFLYHEGYKTEKEVIGGLTIWGINEFEIPIPAFLDLYMEHLIAPFFVFQVLCLVLWSMDDYWYYSLVTLLMLMFFEGMMCKQRQQSLLSLRSMRRPPSPVVVYRMERWMAISSHDLLPGDVISLTSVGTLEFATDERERRRNGARQKKEEPVVLPCDAALIKGGCIVNEAMLTGESVPQVKESLTCTDKLDGCLQVNDQGVDAQWRRHVLFGGTELQQHSETVGTETKTVLTASDVKLRSPNGGCLAVVLRTGYGTSQGGLMRKILFATERVTGTSYETFLFIALLVIFAIGASSVVLHYGWQDESRNKFKLVLHCVMIITSVVPPELPMELSLAVTNSLGALARSLVYCTEPFRVPFAGKVDVLCFDKTGTLTKDQMLLKGVVAPQNCSVAARGQTDEATMAGDTSAASQCITKVENAGTTPEIVRVIMGGCHSLVFSKGKLLGDPLELVTLEASGFSMVASAAGESSTSSIATSRRDGCTASIRILKRFPFSSALKRMSVLVKHDVKAEVGMPMGFTLGLASSPQREHPVPGMGVGNLGALVAQSSTLGGLIVTKGAPEVIAELLQDVPAFYNTTYLHHMSQGKRVLAVAYRRLAAEFEQNKGSNLPRVEAEKGLIFAGFLVYNCSLKPDTKGVMKELVGSNHRVIMITGDSAFTAIDVARKLSMLCDYSPSMGSGPNRSAADTLILQRVDNGSLVWRSAALSDSVKSTQGDIKLVTDKPTAKSVLQGLSRSYSFCVTGPALNALLELCLQSGGAEDWMFMLRIIAPFVNVFARVSPSQKEEIILALNAVGHHTLMVGDGTNDVGALKAAHVGVSIVNDPELEARVEAGLAPGKDSKKKGSTAKDRVARALAELKEQEEDPTVVKLGDASIAAPFTCRRTSVDSVLTVLRHGRCTLVTTIEVYKILALNCLVSSYVMSVLYLKGLKTGDIQMTVNGVISALMFFFLSQAKPEVRLSAVRPPSSVFSSATCVSLVGQFIVHMVSLLALSFICRDYDPSEGSAETADGKFQKNVFNTAMFLLSSTMQINNFVVNYRGVPFIQDIQDNYWMYRSVQLVYASLFLATSGVLEPFNDLLQLVEFPDPLLRTYVILLLIGNFGGCWFVEKFARRLE
jgi:cation-transporting ATPase 13A1